MSKETIHGGHGETVTMAAEERPSGRLLDVPRPPMQSLPLPESFAWFENAVGPLVEGATILLSGSPGSCKSTLATELCLQLGANGIKTLSVLTEESPQRLLDRAVRLSSQCLKETVQAAIQNMHVDSSLLDLHNLPPFLWANVLGRDARHAGCRVIVLDSIQADGVPAGAHRAYARLFEFTRAAKSAGITTVLIAHQTKRGQIAGPRGLEHHADQVLLLRKVMDTRQLFVSKNRYGREQLRGFPLALDPVTGGLRPSPYSEPLAGVARTFLGAVCGGAEIQAMITLPTCHSKAQVQAQGLPRKRVEQLLACVARVPGLDLADLDISINCMLPGDAIFRAPQGLALCMAIVSTLLRQPIPPSHLFLGEVDLCRALRAPRTALTQELSAAIANNELGLPLRVFCPGTAAVMLESTPMVQIVPTETLDEAIRTVWTSLR